MRKIIVMLSIAVLVLGSMSQFSTAAAAPADDDTQHLKIVTTIFPLYDWVQTILGDRAEQADIRMLYSNGVDPHSYQATVADMVEVSSCDLLLYVGGESDAWIGDALQTAVNPNMQCLNCMEILAASVREEDFDEELHTGGSGETGEEREYDEHVWLSLRNAQQICHAVAELLSGIDLDHAGEYQERAAAYEEELKQLDQAYQDAADESAGKTLLFGDRFPFLYLTEDYGLTYYAAFDGCSAESMASFDTVIFLAQKADELNLPCILTIDGSDGRLAQTIVQSTKNQDQEILILDSMQSVTNEKIRSGVTYLSIMRENLEVLKKALS